VKPEEAIAREATRDLVARYNASGDSGRVDGVLELFWPDAAMEVGGPEAPRVHTGLEEIRSIFTGAAATTFRPAATSRAAATASPFRHHVRHFVATHVVDFDDPTHAAGYAYFQVLMPHGLDHWGRYFDAYEARDGEWRFAQRKVVLDGRHAP
jgi:hypothetical protein